MGQWHPKGPRGPPGVRGPSVFGDICMEPQGYTGPKRQQYGLRFSFHLKGPGVPKKGRGGNASQVPSPPQIHENMHQIFAKILEKNEPLRSAGSESENVQNLVFFTKRGPPQNPKTALLRSPGGASQKSLGGRPGPQEGRRPGPPGARGSLGSPRKEHGASCWH